MSKKNTVPFNRFSFTNTSLRYVGKPSGGLHSYGKLFGSYKSGIPAIAKLDGKNVIQIYPGATEDINNVNMIQSYAATGWTTNNVSITVDQIASPLGTTTADLCTANGSGTIQHFMTASSISPSPLDSYNVHGAFFKKGTKGRDIILGAYDSVTLVSVGFNLTTGDARVVATAPDGGYGAVQLNDGWWFFWICYFTPDTPSTTNVTRYHYITDDSGNYSYEQASENYYYWGATDEFNVKPYGTYAPSYLKLALGTYNADVLTLLSSKVPSELRNAVSFRYYPDFDIPAGSFGDKVIYEDSVIRLQIGLVGAETEPRVCVYDYNAASYYVTSDYITAFKNKPLDISIIRASGTLILNGFVKGDGTYTGTPWAASTGNITLGSTSTSTNYAHGLISEPELYQNPEALYFSSATFSNTSSKYITVDNSMTGPFGYNVKATRKIGPYNYTQIEDSRETLNNYSEQLNLLFTTSANLDITADATSDPLGNTNAEFFYENTTSSVSHSRTTSINFVGGNSYVISCYFKAKERTAVRLSHSSLESTAIGIDINLTSLTWANSDASNPVTWGLIKDAGSGWYYCAYGISCVYSLTSNVSITTIKEGNITYVGDVNYGLYSWGFNVTKGAFPKSYAYACYNKGFINDDTLYYPYTNLPDRLKSSTNLPFSFTIAPDFSSTQAIADGNKHCLFSLGATFCYIDSLARIKIDCDGVNCFVSTSKSWEAQQVLGITIIANYNGTNCKVITKGFSTGNGTETGTAFNPQKDGDFYLGMRHTTNDLHLDGLISPPVMSDNSNYLDIGDLKYSNTSDKYMLYDAVVTGPFGSNVPAVRVIDGNSYVQVQKSYRQSITYSDRFDNAWWNYSGTYGTAIATINDGIDPLGTNTACRITTNTPITISNARKYGQFVIGPGTFGYFCKLGTQGSRSGLRYSGSDAVDLQITPTSSWVRYQKYCAGAYPVIHNCWDGAAASDAVVGDNHLYWGAQLEKDEKYLHAPVINNTGSTILMPKDIAYFSYSDNSSWLRDASLRSFSFNFIPYYSSVQLTADGGKKYFFSVNGSSSVDCYLDGSDNKIKIDVGGVNKFTSIAKTWDIQQKINIVITPNNGANCVVTTSGFVTGNGTETGTLFSMQSSFGDFRIGDVPKLTFSQLTYSGSTNRTILYDTTLTSNLKVINAARAGGCRDIAIDTNNVYWTEPTDGKICKMQLAGGVVTELVTGLTTPTHLTVDATNVYYTVSGGNISSVPIAGGSPTSLSSNGGRGLCVNGTTLFFSEGTKIISMPKGGGSETDLYSSGTTILKLAVDATDVYWTDYSGKVCKVPIAGGASTDLATGRTKLPVDLVLSASTVYWTEAGSSVDGKVCSISKSGGSVTEIATSQDSPIGIAIDSAEANIYWNCAAGTLGAWTGAGTVSSYNISTTAISVLASCLSGPYYGIEYSSTNNKVYIGDYDKDYIYSVDLMPLTRSISGRNYLNVEAADLADKTNSENINGLFTGKNGVTVGSDEIVSPIGTLTAEKVRETSATSYHEAWFAPTVSAVELVPYVMSWFMKAGERDEVALQWYNSDTTARGVQYDIGTDKLTSINATWTYRRVLSDGWVYVACSFTPHRTDGWNVYYTQFNNGVPNYTGTTGYGLYLWGFNIVKAQNYLASYIPTSSSAVTRVKDVAYFASANVPSWLRGANNVPFSISFIPNYSSTQLATDASRKYLFSVNGSSSVDCYLDNTDRALKIDVGGVNKFASTSKTWSSNDLILVTITPNNGLNCVVKTNGFTTGDGTETGTSFTMQSSGDFYLGVKHTTTDLQFDGLISAPELAPPQNILEFEVLNFSNSSSGRYILCNSLLSGPFGSNIPAIRNIDGISYIQMEKSFTNSLVYSSDLSQNDMPWNDSTGAQITETYGVPDPLGGTNATNIVPTVASLAHNMWQDIFYRNYSVIIKPNGYNYVFLYSYTPTVDILINLTTLEVVGKHADVTVLHKEFIQNGWVYISLLFASSGEYVEISPKPDATYPPVNYTGDGTSGILVHLTQATNTASQYMCSPIYTTTAARTKNKDYAYFAAASIPSWLRGSTNASFSFNFIPHYSSTQLTVDGGKKYFFSVNGSSSVNCYLDGSDNKIKIDVGGVNKFMSTAKTWVRPNQKITVVITPNNGSNCVVSTSGFTTGNGIETGTSFSMQTDGDLYIGVRHTTNDLQLDGLISEFCEV